MRTFHDAKAMAAALREGLKKKSMAITHSESLELVAAQFGFANWNILAAKLADDGQVNFNSAIPIIRIFAVDKAMEFYSGFLGFTLDWEHRFGDNFPLYAQLSRDGLALHLSEHHGDATPGSKVFITMTGIRAFHRELSQKHYAYAKPGLEEAFWGALTVEVADPFGNRLLFNEYQTEK
ncbi:glyoxalase superfamily protein [Taklimakanibacter lacteus]|uniref:glyoxalase superfamily protein n=1 Tax=Taklimakanibacter lacteus TaxID=2268456 RepID=UPI000E670607